MAIHDGGLLIRAAAKAVPGEIVLVGNLSESGGTFPFLTSFCRNSGPKFAKGDKLWNALLIAGMRGPKSVTGSTNVRLLRPFCLGKTCAVVGGSRRGSIFVLGLGVSSATAPHSAMNRGEIRRILMGRSWL